MFIPSALVARSPGPQACQPFSIQSNVCVGELVAIVACSIAGIGFFCWAIHAIRKMRQSPFNSRLEDSEKPNAENKRADHYVPSAIDNSPLVRRGAVQVPSLPERVRTRLAMSEPEEDFYRSSTPILSGTPSAQDSTTAPRAPRLPPPAGGQPRRNPPHRSGRHGSPARGGAYGERYEYGANGKYIWDVSPSRARGSPLHRSGSGYGSHQTTRRTNAEDSTMYGH